METGQGQVMEPESLDNTSGAGMFPRFLKMPGELQWNVWSFFCPEVNSEPFLLGFIFDESTSEVYKGNALARTTAAARALLAVHQGSRNLALRALPDTITLQEGNALVRFRRERDLILLYHIYIDQVWNLGRRPYIPGFSDSVVNLLMPGDPYDEESVDIYCSFPNLKVVYHICSPNEYKSRDLAWCFSSSTHSSMSLNVPATTIYWPDLLRHREYAEKNISPRKFPVGYNLVKAVTKASLRSGLPRDLDFLWGGDQGQGHLKDIEVWPMVAKDPVDVWRPEGFLSPPDQPFPVLGSWEYSPWVPRPWEL